MVRQGWKELKPFLTLFLLPAPADKPKQEAGVFWHVLVLCREHGQEALKEMDGLLQKLFKMYNPFIIFIIFVAVVIKHTQLQLQHSEVKLRSYLFYSNCNIFILVEQSCSVCFGSQIYLFLICVSFYYFFCRVWFRSFTSPSCFHSTSLFFFCLSSPSTCNSSSSRDQYHNGLKNYEVDTQCLHSAWYRKRKNFRDVFVNELHFW